MAQFRFSLQTVLDQREHEERLCQLALAQAQQVLVQLEQRLAGIQQEIVAANQDLRDNHLTGQINIQSIGVHRRYLAAMKAQVIQLAQQMADARLNIQAKQRKLAEAAKHRKAIEVLRDKQKQRWQDDQAKKERELLDEAGMQIAFANLTIESMPGSAA
ncbi:MAG: flagellar export protein FliJ [Tepidisphaeraceae bacterium]